MDRLQETTTHDDLREAPERLVDLTQDEIYSLPLDEQHDIQLAGAKKRFADLVERVPVLTALAEEQGISEIRSLEDLAPLLLPHSALKSYPLSYLENSRFDRLTQWLNGFTVHDLSKVDASGCDSIDDWIMLLDEKTPIRIMHSTGTSGKLSFLPRSTTEIKAMVTAYLWEFHTFRDEPSLLGVDPAKAPVVFLQNRTGAMAHHRRVDALKDQLFGGDESMIAALYPSRFSADVASIGGRLRAAEQRGELGSVKIAPKLMARREAFMQEHANQEKYLEAFLARIAEFKDRPVVVVCQNAPLYNLAIEAEKRGISNVFAPGSFATTGGGKKGANLPDDWEEPVARFLGPTRRVSAYGMTEAVGATRVCPCGNYHLPAWQIPFVLDPATGEQMPRTGVQTGRYGVYDLVAETHWGGTLSGDQVTLHWGDTTPCGCGRIGPYLEPEIRRYTEQEGGDDKITCAGAPEAHDKALDFILQSIG